MKFTVRFDAFAQKDGLEFQRIDMPVNTIADAAWWMEGIARQIADEHNAAVFHYKSEMRMVIPTEDYTYEFRIWHSDILTAFDNARA